MVVKLILGCRHGPVQCNVQAGVFFNGMHRTVPIDDTAPKEGG